MIPAFLSYISGTTITELQILLDGKPVTSYNAGTDVKEGIVYISDDRLYNIISTNKAGSHTLTMVAKPGFEIYTFTFSRVWQHNVSKSEYCNIIKNLDRCRCVTLEPCHYGYTNKWNKTSYKISF